MAVAVKKPSNHDRYIEDLTLWQTFLCFSSEESGNNEASLKQLALHQKDRLSPFAVAHGALNPFKFASGFQQLAAYLIIMLALVPQDSMRSLVPIPSQTSLIPQA
mmetsp:Transcript_50233/g.99894  ORF Transcript_50233/g.99894 Transcript_50233/m.99894 type:complete len:105 (+) Transcript_50233:87-401(+)